jgi:hypothetical protein
LRVRDCNSALALAGQAERKDCRDSEKPELHRKQLRTDVYEAQAGPPLVRTRLTLT